MNTRPNILLVVFDSLSAQDLNQHRGDLPTLQSLANDSLCFSNAYTCCPESSPARSSLFTGLDMSVHGLWTDGVTLPDHERTLSEIFAAQGYQSWIVGRRQLSGVSNWTTEHARPIEYHHFDWAHGPLHRSRQNAYLTWLKEQASEEYKRVFPREANPDNPVIPASQRQAMAGLPDELSFSAWIGAQVCKRVTALPFFGIAGFVVGQSMGGSAATTEPCDLKALRQADRALGAVLRELPQQTLIIVTSARGSVASSDPKAALRQRAIQVPLMLRSPDIVPELVEGIVGTMDVATTIYEFAGVHPPQRLQGRSLISSPPRGWALSRIRHPEHVPQTALITEGWKLVMDHDASEATGLFDLEADPDEGENLAASLSHQDRLEAMIDLMIDARVALEDRTEPRIAKF